MNSSVEVITANGAAEVAAVKEKAPSAQTQIDGWYARYVLGVLMIVYVFNFIDRQILAILAEEIKADLGVSDAQLGFLFGTAFAVFYATFGIAFGRLADLWNRKQLISLGLGFWSVMTVLSGFARSFLPLAACRFGVGVGEASASPAAFSILYDYFSPKVRTTVLAIYSSGVYIGAGLGLFLGGTILEAWNNAWPAGSGAPFGIKGWQAAFMIVGLPGLLMALWVATLREPIRGASDGVASKQPHPHPFREAVLVLLSMLPVANWWIFSKGKRGRRVITINTAGACAIAIAVWALISLTGGILQWTALGVGVYAVFSWVQSLAGRDPVIFGLIFKCRTLICLIPALGAMTYMMIAIGFWVVPYLQRYHGVSPGEAGLVVGVATASMGFLGIVLGGRLADKLRDYTPRGKLYVWIVGITLSMLSGLFYLTRDNLTLVYVGIFFGNLTVTMAHGPGYSTVMDLMLPRGRAVVSAFSLMVATFVGVALGPYITGHISDVIVASGTNSGEALRHAMLWSFTLPIVGVALVALSLFYIEDDEASLLKRAEELGENI